MDLFVIKTNSDLRELRNLEDRVGRYTAQQFRHFHVRYASGFATKQNEKDFIIKYISDSGEYIVPLYVYKKSGFAVVGYNVYTRFDKLLGRVRKLDQARTAAYYYGLQCHLDNGWMKESDTYRLKVTEGIEVDRSVRKK